MKFIFYRYFLLIFAIIVLAFSAWLILFNPSIGLNSLIVITGAFLSLVYFIQKQALAETKLFKDIFAESNKRFEELSVELNQMIDAKGELTKEEKRVLDTYFNLCSEEYMYFKMGYVPTMAWQAWRTGMEGIMAVERIGNYWKQQKRSKARYGLSF